MNKIKSLAKNPKVQKAVLTGAALAAGAYGGAPAANAVNEYLPKIAAWLGF